MSIPEIPASLERVYLTSATSPSLISNIGQCVMQAFGREEIDHGFISSLIAGPFIEVGNLIHSAIEIADRRVNLVEVFNQLTTAREIDLAKDQRRSHYADLTSAIGESNWAEKLSILKNHIGNLPPLEILSVKNGGFSTRHGQVESAKNLTWPSINYEVSLRSALLGMAGRADRIELQLPNNVLVTDVKTGAITDKEGEAKYEYVLQLAAYEAMIKEIWPDAVIQLFLEAGHVLEVKLNDEIRRDFRERLNTLQSILKSKSETIVSAVSVQTKGPHCLGCSVRHVCATYREVLTNDTFGSSLGTEVIQEVSDGFGTVVKKQFVLGHHVVNLVTATNRRIQLRSKYAWQVSEIAVGEDIYFFNFVGKPNSNRTSASVGLPSNFSDDFFSGRNWAAEIFKP